MLPRLSCMVNTSFPTVKETGAHSAGGR